MGQQSSIDSGHAAATHPQTSSYHQMEVVKDHGHHHFVADMLPLHSDMMPPIDFNGQHSRSTFVDGMVKKLLRVDSVDITNDPRMIGKSVIGSRLDGFANIVFAAMLLCTLAWSAAITLRPYKDGKFYPFTWVGLAGEMMTMGMNLFAVAILIHQAYLVRRILTGSYMGFEMGKALYMHHDYVALRHLAVRSFFWSVPVFVFSTMCVVWDVIQPNLTRIQRGCRVIPLTIICVPLAIMTFVMFHVHAKQSRVFREKMNKVQKYQAPLRYHTEEELTTHLSIHHGQNVSTFSALVGYATD
jgi:hypothetical protein